MKTAVFKKEKSERLGLSQEKSVEFIENSTL